MSDQVTGSGTGGLRTFFLERMIVSHLSAVGFLLSVLTVVVTGADTWARLCPGHRPIWLLLV